MGFIQQQIMLRTGRSDDSLSKIINNLFQHSKTILDKFSSEHLRFKLYTEKGLLTMPEEYFVGTKYEQTFIEDNPSIHSEEFTAQYIPLSWSLKLLLEIPGMYNILRDYMMDMERETNIVTNFVQADLWKKYAKIFIVNCAHHYSYTRTISNREIHLAHMQEKIS